MTELNLSDLKNSILDLSKNEKRANYLEWGEYFMAMAILTSKRSKDPVTQVGSVIVNPDNRIVGVGYNGLPSGCSDDKFPWCKNSDNPLENKYMYVVHAEVNAILNKNSSDVKGCDIYTALFPCNECTKVIIQSGIKCVIYMSDKYAKTLSTIASKKMLEASGIEYFQFVPKNKKILIDFEEFEDNLLNQNQETPKK